ncbi:hypothetical protein J5N97_004207 [Dioscorea zingiberensis]|uniref:Glycosyltransferase n=1 Tax=Dioscorea zingiberensis TaxID=325984 RepID=A0A9D5D5Q3_9LILI|nr:hypothetical protein J5N97_004207 [Dioscorea zingiberensis]
MIDLGMLLAQHGALVTFMTTPVNASRIRTTINIARESGLPIRFLELHFPCRELGLPEGCENADVVSTQKHMFTFFEATRQLKQPLELYLREHKPPPSCIVSDFCQPWTRDLAQSFGIPRLTFFSMSNFAILCYYNIWHYKVYSDVISDDTQVFTVPGLTEKIVVTKAQAPGFFGGEGWEKVREEVREAEFEADGILVNSFHALEPSYFELYQKAMGKKVWTIGPLFLHKKDMACLATRGNRSSLDVDYCMQWLDSMKPRSVLYISFGSLTQVKPSQLMEIGKGLEASNYPFIWVIKNNESSQEIEEWLSGGYEERVSPRGIIVRGWAPQLMILSHSAVGGFLSHCGWNSTLEAICAGVPMITWPHFSEQFLNERFVVDVLRIGVSVGVKVPNVMMQAASKKMLIVNGEVLEKVMKKVMDEEEGMEKRRRVEEIRKVAREAMEVGGSSYENVMHLIHWFSNDDKKKCMKEEEY